MDIKELNVNREQKSNANHPWEYARANVVQHLLKKFFANKPTIKNVVDIGCGDIFFLNQFCQHYPVDTAVAVDTAFTETIISELKDSNDKVLFFNNIGEVKLTNGKASIVFLMDVIEHIDHDSDFLKQVAKAPFVDENTLFLITVPAFNGLFCAHDKWLGHYRRYNQKMLRNSTCHAGLIYIDGGYFFCSLLFPRLLQKIIERLREPKTENVTGIAEWNGGKFISWFYKTLLWCDFRIAHFLRKLGIQLPGLSTYAICKKNTSCC